MKSQEEVVKNLRAIQVLNQHFNSTLGEIIMPTCILTSLVLIIISNYATVKWFREVKTFIFACASTIRFAFEVLPTISEINDDSVHLLRYLHRSNGNSNSGGEIQKANIRKGYLWKVGKSTRPLCINIRPYFSMKRSTVATYMSVAIEYTFQLLIMY